MANRRELKLSLEEQRMLHGEEGLAVQRAMEIVVALGQIYGARCLIPISSAQVAGVSYKNLGKAGLDFLREWANQGARVRVPTTLNPAGMDVSRWRALDFPEEFARQQIAVIRAYERMGVSPTCTCTPYLVRDRPRMGDHLAWAESSAVSFANSVLGARTNREGGPSALAAAICGRTAAYGLHLVENRLARWRVEVRCSLQTVSDWSALGYLVGREVRNGVPYFVMDEAFGDAPRPDLLTDEALLDQLKSLGAAMAASGAVALYHVAGVTPEAQRGTILAADARRLVMDDLQPGYAALNQHFSQIDLVSIGCPHASPQEIVSVAGAISGRHLKAALWVTTAHGTRQRMEAEVQAIEAAGGEVVSDTCLVVAPVQELGFRTMATNSAKMALYTPSHSGLRVRFGSLEQCIEAALCGRWPPEAGSKSAPTEPHRGSTRRPMPDGGSQAEREL